jgi:hypothetical protein
MLKSITVIYLSYCLQQSNGSTEVRSFLFTLPALAASLTCSYLET